MSRRAIPAPVPKVRPRCRGGYPHHSVLGNPVGFFLYLALRNDLSWKLLSDAERARVLHANALHNTRRPDYADPEQYAGGLGFDSSDDRLLTRRGRSLHDFSGVPSPPPSWR